MFFFPLEIGGKSTIPVDHIIMFITSDLAVVAKFYILLVMYIGAALPFIRRNWNKDGMTIFSQLRRYVERLWGLFLYLT